jgi:hypothetical protein
VKSRPASDPPRRRYRKTQAVADTIIAVLADYPSVSMSTRQIFYQCVSRGAIDNCVSGYDKVQRLVVQLRRSGEVEYHRVVDRTRLKHQRPGWEGAEDILRACGSQFRRNLWSTQDTVVMVGLEKQALEGVFAEAVDEYGASLWVLHGYGSESFLFEWATEIQTFVERGKNVAIYYFGDHDPTGLDIERHAAMTLAEHGAEFEWRRAGLLHSDFDEFELVNVPVKRRDTRAKSYLGNYGDRAAELDALPPDVLQSRILDCIDEHLNVEEYERLLREEAIQRDSLNTVARNWQAAVAGAKGAA